MNTVVSYLSNFWSGQKEEAGKVGNVAKVGTVKAGKAATTSKGSKVSKNIPNPYLTYTCQNCGGGGRCACVLQRNRTRRLRYSSTEL